VNVDTQNIVNQLVLAEIDVHGRYGDEECLTTKASELSVRRVCPVEARTAKAGDRPSFKACEIPRGFEPGGLVVHGLSTNWTALAIIAAALFR